MHGLSFLGVFTGVAEDPDHRFGKVARHDVPDEGAGRFGLRTAEDVDDVARFYDFALVHHDHALADLLYDVHFVRDHDDRDAELAVDALQKRKRGGRRFRVEGRGSFVGEKHLRVVRKGARDADALLLPARELRGILVGVVGQAHEFDQGRDLLADLLFGKAGEFEGQRDVSVDRARGEEVELLEDHADRTAGFTEFRFREVGENLAVYDDVPRRGTVEKIDAAHERALPGARAPDDAEDFARTDFERNVLERIKGLPLGRRVGLRDVL